MTPESLRLNPILGPILIMTGYCVVHLLEHTINAHFHYGEETHHDEFISRRTGYSVLGGLSVHALFDGVAIGSGFVVSNALGWLIFLDRKSTRLNSSHLGISYAVFCLKK